jgi:hypothetical protein
MRGVNCGAVVGGCAGAYASSGCSRKGDKGKSGDSCRVQEGVAGQELRWHLAVMVPRLALNEKERRDVTSALASYLEDRSSIVKTFALQGLADLAEKSGRGRDEVMEILHSAMRNGTAAMKARPRKLLGPLEDDDVEDKAQRAKRDSLRQTRGKRHRFALRRPRLE